MKKTTIILFVAIIGVIIGSAATIWIDNSKLSFLPDTGVKLPTYANGTKRNYYYASYIPIKEVADKPSDPLKNPTAVIVTPTPMPEHAKSGTSQSTSGSLENDYPDPVVTQKVLVIIYDTHLQNPGYPHGGATAGPVQLTYAMETALEEASYEPASTSAGSAYYRPNYEIVIQELVQYSTPSPQLPGYPEPNSGTADYNAILNTHNVCSKVNQGLIDEVWLWADRTGGYWEAIMAGPADMIFSTNGPEIIREDCELPISIMGFNYERYESYNPVEATYTVPGVNASLHSFGHRVENTIAHFLDGKHRANVTVTDNYFYYDGKIGYAGVLLNNRFCGNTHWAPNARTLSDDYEYNLTNLVNSYCNDWNPQLTSPRVRANCNNWTCLGSGYQKWWLNHMPGRERIVDMTKLNGDPMPNWWKLIARYDTDIDQYYAVAETTTTLGPLVGQNHNEPVIVSTDQQLSLKQYYAGDNINRMELCFHGNFEGPGWDQGWVCLRDITPSFEYFDSRTADPMLISDFETESDGYFYYSTVQQALVAKGYDARDLNNFGITWSANVAQNENSQLCLGNGDLIQSDGTRVKYGCSVSATSTGSFKISIRE